VRVREPHAKPQYPCLELLLPARPESLAEVRRRFRAWLLELDAESDELEEIILACSEACANSVEHSTSERQQLVVRARLLLDGIVHVLVRDYGRWRFMTRPPERGRGLSIVRELMDAVAIRRDDDGTSISLYRQLRKPPADMDRGSQKLRTRRALRAGGGAIAGDGSIPRGERSRALPFR
jgi:anti-sigma regulatory factor (Ser/Thr protein kinase)